MAATAIKFTIEEIDALSKCSPEAVKMYVLGIRPRMDFKTGYVGRVTRMCYQAMREVMDQYAPPAGSHVRDRVWTKEALKHRLKELVSVGLLNWVKIPTRGLLFKCLHAVYDDCKGFFAPAGAAPQEHPVVSGKNIVINESVSDIEGGEDLPSCTPPPGSDNLSSGATRMEQGWKPERVVVESVSRETIGLDISGLDENRYQSVVNEFVGFWAARSTRRDEVGWLHHLVKSFEFNMRQPAGRGGVNRSGFDVEAVAVKLGIQSWPGESARDFEQRVRQRMQ